MDLNERLIAVRPKLEATRKSRERAHYLASAASAKLGEIATCCSVGDETFATLQTSAFGQHSLASAIERLASVKAMIYELDALMPALQVTWGDGE